MWGTVVIMDLDRFKEMTRRMGWTRYRPNVITGELSRMVEEFSRRWSARVVYGLDWDRGTEEAVLELPGVRPEEIMEDLERIRVEIKRMGGSISMGVAYGPIYPRKARNRREAYSSATAKLALKALREAKRLGGDRIVVVG